MNILGVHPGIDATAAVIIDGRIVSAIAEERISRRKLHTGFPYAAILSSLDVAELQPCEVDVVAFSFNDYFVGNPLFNQFLLNPNGSSFDVENEIGLLDLTKEALRQTLSSPLQTIRSLSVRRMSSRYYDRNLAAYLNALVHLGLPSNTPIEIHDHHASHASNAYYTSGFDECLLVTADGCGDGLSMTTSRARGGAIERLYTADEEESAGKFYAAVTKYLGFSCHRHEGKTTGLAAYGNPETCLSILAPCLALSDDRKTLTSRFGKEAGIRSRIGWLSGLVTGGFFKSRYVHDLLLYFESNLRGHTREDIAAAAQKILEDTIVGHVSAVVEETGLRSL